MVKHICLIIVFIFIISCVKLKQEQEQSSGHYLGTTIEEVCKFYYSNSTLNLIVFSFTSGENSDVQYATICSHSINIDIILDTINKGDRIYLVKYEIITTNGPQFGIIFNSNGMKGNGQPIFKLKSITKSPSFLFLNEIKID